MMLRLGGAVRVVTDAGPAAPGAGGPPEPDDDGEAETEATKPPSYGTKGAWV